MTKDVAEAIAAFIIDLSKWNITHRLITSFVFKY